MQPRRSSDWLSEYKDQNVSKHNSWTKYEFVKQISKVKLVNKMLSNLSNSDLQIRLSVQQKPRESKRTEDCAEL